MNVVDSANTWVEEEEEVHLHEEPLHEEPLHVADHLHVGHHHLVGDDLGLEKGMDAEEHPLGVDPGHLVIERMMMIGSRVEEMR